MQFRSCKDSNLPERPIEIRVWYLRGALDDDIGMIRALKALGMGRPVSIFKASKLDATCYLKP